MPVSQKRVLRALSLRLLAEPLNYRDNTESQSIVHQFIKRISLERRLNIVILSKLHRFEPARLRLTAKRHGRCHRTASAVSGSEARKLRKRLRNVVNRFTAKIKMLV